MEFSLGKRYVYLRRVKGINQETVAEYLNISRPYYGAIEKEIRPMQEEFVLKLTKYYSVPVEYFTITPLSELINAELELLFNRLLHDNLENIEETVKTLESPVLNFKQEFMVNLLLGAYYIRKRESTKINQLMDTYFYVFPISSFSKTLVNTKKYVDLFFAEYYAWQKKDEKSLSYWGSLVETLQDTPLKELAVLSFITSLINNNQFGKALLEADKLISKDYYQSPDLLAKVLIRISSIHIQLDHYEEALLTLDRFKKEVTEMQTNIFHAIASQHRGIIAYKQGKVEESIVLYTEALDILQKDRRATTVLFSLIDCYLMLEDWKNARKFLDHLKSHSLNEYNKMIVLAMDGEICLYEKKVKRGLQLINRSLNYFIENDLKDNQRHIYGQLGIYYNKIGSFKRSSEYYHKKEMLI